VREKGERHNRAKYRERERRETDRIEEKGDRQNREKYGEQVRRERETIARVIEGEGRQDRAMHLQGCCN